MSQRTLVPIFVFWAILTIITPTLILLSENSKADLDVNGNAATEGVKPRRMIGYIHNHITRCPPSPAKPALPEEELTSAPAPSPMRSQSSYHNHSLTSNKTDDGLAHSSTRMHVKVKQTDIK